MLQLFPPLTFLSLEPCSLSNKNKVHIVFKSTSVGKISLIKQYTKYLEGFYPTALKDCRGVLFSPMVSGWASGWSRLYLGNHKL